MKKLILHFIVKFNSNICPSSVESTKHVCWPMRGQRLEDTLSNNTFQLYSRTARLFVGFNWHFQVQTGQLIQMTKFNEFNYVE